MKIVSVEQMRHLEAASAAAGVSTDTLIETAGLAAARVCIPILGIVAGSKILVLVGPGNNGGDALVVARHLQRWGARVTGYLVSSRPEEDPKLKSALELGVPMISASEDPDLTLLNGELARAGLVVDGILGTGKTRPLEGVLQKVMLALGSVRSNNRSMITVALDTPTGMDAETGAVDPACSGVDHTITFGYPKLGHYRFPGSEVIGKLHIVDIGIPDGLDHDVHVELLTSEGTAARLPSRTLNSHKGTFGHTLVVAGSRNYVGAAYLASQGAARVGSGLVTLASPESIHPILASKLTEVIHSPVLDDWEGRFNLGAALSLKASMETYSALLIGCGFGRSPGLIEFIRKLLLDSPQPSIPVVIDADGLNNLAQINGWWNAVSSPLVLTPHPGEMSTLTGIPTTEIQEQRVNTTIEWSRRWRQTVVLKGAHTVIADPNGRCYISPFANPALASGGTGDVLTGIIAGLMAQGLSPADAACCGVYLHGAAGEVLRSKMGDTGTLASDLLPELPLVMRNLKNP